MFEFLLSKLPTLYRKVAHGYEAQAVSGAISDAQAAQLKNAAAKAAQTAEFFETPATSTSVRS